jgi:hypothetical protein
MIRHCSHAPSMKFKNAMYSSIYLGLKLFGIVTSRLNGLIFKHAGLAFATMPAVAAYTARNRPFRGSKVHNLLHDGPFSLSRVLQVVLP